MRMRGVCFCFDGIGKDGLAVAREAGRVGGAGTGWSGCDVLCESVKRKKLGSS